MTELHEQPILVTGGTGFAGSHLLEALAEAGYRNLHTTSLQAKRPNWVSPDVVIHQVELTDSVATAEFIAELQPVHIYHLASMAVVGQSFEIAQSLLSNNIALQLNVLEAVRSHAPGARLLTIGSAEEYGAVRLGPDEKINEGYPLSPVNPYAVSKTTQDLLAHAYHQSYQLQIVRTRPFNHIGERQTPHFAISSFAKQIVAIERGQQSEIKVGNLQAVRDFTDVKDMVRAYITLMEHGRVGEVYNIGSGVGRSIEELLAELCRQATAPIKVSIDQNLIRPLDVPRLVADNGKIAQLGWFPTIPLPNTLQRMLEYWRGQS